MYEIKTRVRLSEVSADGCMTLPGIINTFQDASIFQSEDLGVRNTKRHGYFLPGR